MKIALWFKRVLLLGVAVFLLVQLWFFGWVVYWQKHNPEQTRFMALRVAEASQKPKWKLYQRWVPYSNISSSIKRAVIAAEDARFLEHDGFDWQGIQLAIQKNKKKHRWVAGGSTITQQLAKNLFLTPERSLFRKSEEALIALMLEACWSKERILEVYLNVIEWGDGVFGIEAAAQHYYGTHASRLSLSQSARLAAMIPRPRYYDRVRGSRYLSRKSSQVMLGMGAVSLP